MNTRENGTKKTGADGAEKLGRWLETAMTRRFEIVKGPGRDMIFDACKYAFDECVQFPLEFSIAAGYTTPRDNPGCAYIKLPVVDLIISGIDHDYGDGRRFILSGLCKADLDPLRGAAEPVYSKYRFKAGYNTRTRDGVIYFVDVLPDAD